MARLFGAEQELGSIKGSPLPGHTPYNPGTNSAFLLARTFGDIADTAADITTTLGKSKRRQGKFVSDVRKRLLSSSNKGDYKLALEDARQQAFEAFGLEDGAQIMRLVAEETAPKTFIQGNNLVTESPLGDRNVQSLPGTSTATQDLNNRIAAFENYYPTFNNSFNVVTNKMNIERGKAGENPVGTGPEFAALVSVQHAALNAARDIDRFQIDIQNTRGIARDLKASINDDDFRAAARNQIANSIYRAYASFYQPAIISLLTASSAVDEGDVARMMTAFSNDLNAALTQNNAAGLIGIDMAQLTKYQQDINSALVNYYASIKKGRRDQQAFDIQQAQRLLNYKVSSLQHALASEHGLYEMEARDKVFQYYYDSMLREKQLLALANEAGKGTRGQNIVNQLAAQEKQERERYWFTQRFIPSIAQLSTIKVGGKTPESRASSALTQLNVHGSQIMSIVGGTQDVELLAHTLGVYSKGVDNLLDQASSAIAQITDPDIQKQKLREAEEFKRQFDEFASKLGMSEDALRRVGDQLINLIGELGWSRARGVMTTEEEKKATPSRVNPRGLPTGTREPSGPLFPREQQAPKKIR